MPFKKGFDDKKKLFLKTLEQMLSKNQLSKSYKKQKLYININGKKRLVYTGDKGGKYYIKKVKNKVQKVYIKDKKLIYSNKQTGGNIDIQGALTIAGLFTLSKLISEKKQKKKIIKRKKVLKNNIKNSY